MPDQGEPFAPCLHIPDLRSPIPAAGHQFCAVRRESHRIHRQSVSGGGAELCARFGVPDMRLMIVAGMGESFAVGRQGDAVQLIVLLSRIGKQVFAGLQVADRAPASPILVRENLR